VWAHATESKVCKLEFVFRAFVVMGVVFYLFTVGTRCGLRVRSSGIILGFHQGKRMEWNTDSAETGRCLDIARRRCGL
jgi:hypothetical protein